MLPARGRNVSLMSALYEEMVRENHILREIDRTVDFSFVRDIVKDSYCEFYGRAAHAPELLFRLLFLQTMYRLSDEQVIEDTRVNMAYKWFAGLNIEDSLPDPSLLSRFRRHRLGCSDVDQLLVNIVKQCVDKGLIKSTALMADSTHTHANTKKRDPLQVLKDASKRLYKSVCKDYPDLKEQLPKRPEVTAERQRDDIEGTKAMLHYLAELGEKVEKSLPEPTTKVAERLDIAKRIVEDERLLSYKGIASAVDPDARFGWKTSTESFYGYKEHIAVLEKEEIITAVVTTPGSTDDGQQLPSLLEQTSKLIKVEEILADTAYSGKDNLTMLQEKNVKAIIPLSPAVYSGMERREGFTCVKDGKHLECPAGHLSYRRTINGPKNSKENRRYMYYFDVEVCKRCPLREGCYKPDAKSRTYSIRILSDEHQKQIDLMDTELFKERSKQRCNVERKHSEMKIRHGMTRARYQGLFFMHLQAVLTAFVVNAKRMVKLEAAIRAAN